MNGSNHLSERSKIRFKTVLTTTRADIDPHPQQAPKALLEQSAVPFNTTTTELNLTR